MFFGGWGGGKTLHGRMFPPKHASRASEYEDDTSVVPSSNSRVATRVGDSRPLLNDYNIISSLPRGAGLENIHVHAS